MLTIGHGNAGLVVDAFLTPAFSLCFTFYFYFCLTSFADSKGFENFGYGAQATVPGLYNQPMMASNVNGTFVSESDRATTLTTNNTVMQPMYMMPDPNSRPQMMMAAQQPMMMTA